MPPRHWRRGSLPPPPPGRGERETSTAGQSTPPSPPPRRGEGTTAVAVYWPVRAEKEQPTAPIRRPSQRRIGAGEGFSSLELISLDQFQSSKVSWVSSQAQSMRRPDHKPDTALRGQGQIETENDTAPA